MPGAPTPVDVKDKGVVKAAQFAVEAQQQVLKEAGKEEKLALVKVVSAQHQVVAGSKYILTLQVKAGEELKTAEASVWVRLWLEPPERYKLMSWKFVDDKASKP